MGMESLMPNTRKTTPPCLSLPNLLLWSVINKLTCNGGR